MTSPTGNMRGLIRQPQGFTAKTGASGWELAALQPASVEGEPLGIVSLLPS